MKIDERIIEAAKIIYEAAPILDNEDQFAEGPYVTWDDMVESYPATYEAMIEAAMKLHGHFSTTAPESLASPDLVRVYTVDLRGVKFCTAEIKVSASSQDEAEAQALSLASSGHADWDISVIEDITVESATWE